MPTHPSILLVQFRKRFDLTQQGLADMLNTSVRTLQGWEQAAAFPPPCVPLLLALLGPYILAERERVEQEERLAAYRAQQEAERKTAAERAGTKQRKQKLTRDEEDQLRQDFENAERQRKHEEAMDEIRRRGAAQREAIDQLARKAAAYDAMMRNKLPAARLVLDDRDRRVVEKIAALGRSSTLGDQHAAWDRLGSMAQGRGINPFDLLREVDFGES